MFPEALIIFFVVMHLRKTLRTFSPMAKWDKVLTKSLYGIVIFFIIQAIFLKRIDTIWIWHLLIVIIAVATFKLPEFTTARPAMLAVLPLLALFIIKDLLKLLDNDLYQKTNNYFQIAFAIATTWLISVLIRSNKQQKALEKERKKTREEEERNKFVSAQKAELELLVAQRTSELTNQKNELQHALTELTSTQKQLIQSEKMASLGELTAGIAHEIQNPLNFVNNFSEVNTELIGEMQLEIKKGNLLEVEAIANDIMENEQKILYHGNRAGAIVKGMLQHSRSSTSQKEPTDINALADEYLRLSYHGLRAKDKTFNATMKTDLDKNIEKINVVPQDIGRVLLNLFTNAFYTVTERKKQQPLNYEPTVTVTTRRLDTPLINGTSGVEISVKDNGMGIPEKVLDKIFQPFFTTKPAGQGTGLGLSLSYDIIKAHGGELKVETRESEGMPGEETGAEFIIHLPAV